VKITLVGSGRDPFALLFLTAALSAQTAIQYRDTHRDFPCLRPPVAIRRMNTEKTLTSAFQQQE
jgi:hypothetical protein